MYSSQGRDPTHCDTQEDDHGGRRGADPGHLEATVDAFNRHDLDAIMEHFAEDATLDMPRGPHPWGQRFVGHAQVRVALAGRFKGLPDVSLRERARLRERQHGILRVDGDGHAAHRRARRGARHAAAAKSASIVSKAITYMPDVGNSTASIQAFLVHRRELRCRIEVPRDLVGVPCGQRLLL
jgi:hypothetical protein